MAQFISRCSSLRRQNYLQKALVSYSSVQVALLVLGMLLLVHSTQAHLLTGYEMAIGRWELTWRQSLFERQRDFIEEVIFPRTAPPNADGASNANATRCSSPLNDGIPDVPKRQRRKRRRRKLVCLLDLKSDGTFCLEPFQTHDNNDDNDYVRQPLKGEWILHQNPYCVTDRQFDTLLLLSYPRVKRIKEWDKQFAMLEMRCQLQGRFGMKSVRDFSGWSHGRSAGKLVRGSVMLVRREQHGDVDLRKSRFFIPKWRRKIIIAQFSAKPIPSAVADTDVSEDAYACNDDEWTSFDGEEDHDEI